MELKSFRVTNYRNILDSGIVEVGRIAALVGQNESGKSNLLAALNGINPFDGATYKLTEDWPIDQWPPPKGNPVVCTATFSLSGGEIESVFSQALNPPFEGAPPPTPPNEMSIAASRDYSNTLSIDFGQWKAALQKDRADNYIKSVMPKCVYMDEYAIFNGSHPNFPDLNNRRKQSPSNLPESERTLLMALDLASLDLGDLVSAQPSQRTYFTTASSVFLTRRFADKWKQKSIKFDIRVDGSYISIFVQDDGLNAPIPLERRSSGFRWYVSFIWRFTAASEGEFKNCILLLDEPGVRLHHAGHADLLQFFSALSETNAVIYTTHLATMIDPAYPERIRIMEVHDHHPRVIDGVVSSQEQPMMVIEASLGLTGGMGGLLGARQNLIVEGVDDMLILQKLSGVLRASNDVGLSDRIYLLPAKGASKTPMFAAFMIGNGFDAGVLVDSDKAGDDAIQKIKDQRVAEAAIANKAKFKFLQLGKIAGKPDIEFAIEDLFPVSFYLECVNDAYGTNLTEADLGKHETQIVKRVAKALQTKGRIKDDLDKRIVMAAMQKRFNEFSDIACLPTGTTELARKVFAGINKIFS